MEARGARHVGLATMEAGTNCPRGASRFLSDLLCGGRMYRCPSALPRQPALSSTKSAEATGGQGKRKQGDLRSRRRRPPSEPGLRTPQRSVQARASAGRTRNLLRSTVPTTTAAFRAQVRFRRTTRSPMQFRKAQPATQVAKQPPAWEAARLGAPASAVSGNKK